MSKEHGTNDFCTLLGVSSLVDLIDKKLAVINLDTMDESVTGVIEGSFHHLSRSSLILFITNKQQEGISIQIKNDQLVTSLSMDNMAVKDSPKKGFTVKIY